MIAMSRALLLLARFVLSAWFGAATLFVIIGVREVRFPEFSSTIRDQLVLLRFPMYYACGFTLLGIALVSQVILIGRGWRRSALFAACGLTAVALGLMVYDYPCIYRPLEQMITPPGQTMPAAFLLLHRWSETVNAVQLGCALAAALTLCSIDGPPDRRILRDGAN
jgi:hypothetical protein